MPILTLYHGSRVRFDQLSNAYHYTGNGKMGAGWGIYLSKSPQTAFFFASQALLLLSTIWVIDGKKVYSYYLNADAFFEIPRGNYAELETQWNNLRTHNHRDLLLRYLEQHWAAERFWEAGSTELAKAQQLHQLVLRKVQQASTVHFALPHPVYLYTIKVDARRVFDNVDSPDESLRRTINDRLRYEKRKFHWPDHEVPRKNYNNIYGKLYHLFSKRYRYSKAERDFAKMTSLFLYRIGYDIMQTHYLDNEYLLFDTSRAEIVECRKIT